MPNAKRRCTCCKEYGPADDGIKTIAGWFLSAGHVIAYSRRKQEKDRAKQDRAERQSFKQRKKEHRENDGPNQFDLTKKAAQKLANALDAGLACISCGCNRSVQFCGGHFRTVGAHRELALDLRNIHGQCNRYCNLALSGNVGGTKTTRGFRSGLLERYGPALLEFLEAYHPPKKYEPHELIAIRKEYAAETKRLKSGLGPSRDWRKI